MNTQKRWTPGFVTIICLTTILPIVVEGKIQDEKGEAYIDNLFCTNEGNCLVIYHREYMPSDVMQYSIPHICVIRISEEGSFQNITPSFPVPSTFWVTNTWGLIQEDTDTLRLIGWVKGDLTEVWWFKQNETLEIRNLGNYFSYSGYNHVLYPQQIRYEAEVQNYTLVGYSERNGTDITPVVVSTNGLTTNFIDLREILGQYISSYAVFIATNSSESFHASSIFNTNTIKVRHLSNMKEINETIFEFTGAPYEKNIRNYHSLLGLDRDPYVGVSILDPKHEDKTLESYEHTFELVNLRKCTSIVVTVPAKAWYFCWNGLIDESGDFHGFFSDYKQDLTRYIKVSSGGEIKLDTSFEIGFNIVHKLKITFWGEKYIIGAIDEGMFLFELSTGSLINYETEVISYISYPRGIPWDSFSGLSALVVITLCWKTHKKKEIER